MSSLDDIAAGSADDIASKLDAERDRTFAPAFRFDEEGATVSGVVTAVDSREGKFGLYPIVTVDTAGHGDLFDDNGKTEHAIHAFGMVLADKLGSVNVGDTVAVRYEGQKFSKAGNEFKNYTVLVEKAN